MAPRVRRSWSRQSQPSLSSSAQAEPRQHLFVAFQIHCQGGQNDGRIGLVAMTNAEVDAIQVQNAPMHEASGAASIGQACCGSYPLQCLFALHNFRDGVSIFLARPHYHILYLCTLTM